ncbi:MAG: transglycosylase domain-containing protein [Acidimicrobiia bacterium]|nr:transglycosylase domain-containing protein [Acidimicrobiia bacterium]
MDPSIHLVERRERRGKRVASLAMIAVIVVLGASLFGMFAFLETNAAFGTVEDVSDSLICDPDDYDLSFPALGRLSEVYTSDGVLLGKITERNSQPVPINEIPDIVRDAVVSAEDGDFYDHEGIDFSSILSAAIDNARYEGTRGGSTITQQIIKKNVLSDEITLDRKICEAVIAAELERTFTKDEILEFYLNSQFFGANAYGVAAASQEYFGKDLDDVSIAEAAAIAVPIRNPSYYDMRHETQERLDIFLDRRNSVIKQMEKNGFISEEESLAAQAEPLEPIPRQSFEEVDPRIILEAKERLLADPSYGLGDTYLERKRAIFGCPANDTECEGGGGLTITVTVNYEQQLEANRILRSWFRDREGPTGAIAMIENETGAIRVISSGLDYGDDFAAGERKYDLAVEGRRQAGSSFKPLALIAALENGSQFGWPITLGSYWDQTSPQKIECGFPCSPQGDIWTVNNAGGGGSGITTLEQATYTSKNTVYAQVSFAVGPENIVEAAHRVGIDSPLSPVLSIALGTQSVTPLEMAAAYSTLANYGEKVDSYLIESVVDADGNVIYEHEPTRARVLDAALSASVVRTLEKVPRSGGTAPRANIGRPQFGKTGTAQNFQDVWFVGGIPQYTTAVWVGYADAQIEMVSFYVYNEKEDREQFVKRAYGGSVAGPVWNDFMTYITQDLPVEEFPPNPDGTEAFFRVPKTEVPDVSDMDEDEAEDAIHKAGLRAKVELVASAEEEGTFLDQSPAAGSEVTQGGIVTVRFSSGIPPEMINLIGLSLEDVEAAITLFNEESGLNLSWTLQNFPTDEPSAFGRVVGTNPPAGSLLEAEQLVIIFVGVPDLGD